MFHTGFLVRWPPYLGPVAACRAHYAYGMPARRTVFGVVLTSVLVTTLHYADNYLNLTEYPGPDWIAQEVVVLAWVLFTLIGVAAYLLYRAGRAVESGLYLLAYSVTGLSSLGHYAHGAPEDFTAKMHAGIWADGFVGLAVALLGVIILSRFRSSDVSRGRDAEV